ncbi:MAG: alpha-ketoacid dehydrogenase subunit beta [Gammaproteobacteria bacterium]|nr:alpha-ketoacid dehydrogenase subunit beta [Gammaproteobacteria bacterium]
MPWADALIESQSPRLTPPLKGRALSYIDALNEALMLALDLDPNVFILGQGVNDPSAMFGVTRQLEQRFGSQRVFDTPLSEEGLTGICVGAAMTGLRPVYCHNRPDFLLLAFNQMVNHASKVHYMDNGQTNVPLVMWAAIGRGWGSGSQHSQAIQGLLLTVPGLKIVMPSTPYDAKGLMLAAIADNNPVLIFEHRWLMKQTGIVPGGIYNVPIGQGIYRRRGDDITIVGSSHTLQLAMQAVDSIRHSYRQQCISADIIDLRTIKPLDKEMILASVRKTGRVLIVDTGWAMGGVCAEIGCLIAENCPGSLRFPVRRIGLPDVPTPAGYTLEQFYYPTAEKIAAVVIEMCA